MLSDWRVRLRAVFRRAAMERELDDELRFHLERQARKLVQAGVPPAEARRRARAELGGLAQVTEECRDARGVGALEALHRDVRNGIRVLAGRPGFSLAIVLTLALGIGANTAIFSIVNGVLLRPLPVDHPEALAAIEGPAGTGTPWTYAIWQEIHRRPALFAGALAWAPVAVNLAATGETDVVSGAYVSGSFFDVLGLRPVLGRWPTEADDARGGGPDGPVLVISHRFWRQRLGGAPDAIGRGLLVSGRRFTIVGVAPEGFSGLDVGRAADVYLPIGTESTLRGAQTLLDQRSSWWLSMMVRLRPGQTIASATDALRAMEPEIRAAAMPEGASSRDKEAFAHDARFTVRQNATGNSSVRGRYERPLQILLAAVGLVLLIACANVATLLLVRATGRRHEMGVRLALGAARGQLVRQLFVESGLLAAAGTALAVPLAHWTATLLVLEISTPGSPVFLDLGSDWRVVAFTILLAAATTVLFGTVPVVRATRVDAAESLKHQSRTAAPGGRLDASGALIVVQVALSLVLVVGAGLLVRTFVGLATLPLGFDADRLLVSDLTLPAPSVLPPAVRPAEYAQIVDTARHVPGVERAAVARVVPLTGGLWRLEFAPADDLQVNASKRCYVNGVSPDWFTTLGIPVLDGRAFLADDEPGAPRVAIVNEIFARTMFNGQRAVGRTIVQSPSDPGAARLQVVGVVGNTYYRSLRETMEPTVYLPLDQVSAPISGVTLFVRAAAPPAAGLSRRVTEAVRAADERLRLTPVAAYAAELGGTIRQERLLAVLASVFGLLAVGLAAIGLYGVTQYAVARRERELAIRLTLGAVPVGVAWTTLRRVAGLVGVGLLIGLALSVWATRLVASALFGLSPRDPVTLMLAVASLAAVACAAAWLPARRVARLDPMSVLREG